MRNFIIKSAAALAFLILVSTPSFASEDITDVFISEGVLWPLADYLDEEIDPVVDTMELNWDEMPVEYQLKADPDYDPPVLTGVRLDYPRNSAEDEQARYVQVWVSSDKNFAKKKNKKSSRRSTSTWDKVKPGTGGSSSSRNKGDSFNFREVFAGRVDDSGEIEFAPILARKVFIRFFMPEEAETAAIPSVSMIGEYAVEDLRDYETPESVHYPYVAFIGDTPVGYLDIHKEFDGRTIELKTSSGFKERITQEGETSEKETDQDCSYWLVDGFYIDEFECIEHNSGNQVKGTQYSSEFEIEGDVQFDMEEMIDFVERAGFSRREIQDMLDELDEMETSFRSKDEKRPIPMEAMYDAVAEAGMVVGVKHTFVTLDLEMYTNVTVTARVMEFLPSREGRADLFLVWVYDKNYMKINEVALVERDGSVLRLYDYTMGMEFWMVDDLEEWDMEWIEMDYEKMLADMGESLRNVVEMPDGVSYSHTKIRWNEMPPEFLQLDGPRQNLIAVEEIEPGVFEAEIESIRRTDTDEPLNASEPLSQGEIDSYLLYDDVIVTNNDTLIDLAYEITDGEEDPLEVSVLIFNWLIRNISPFTKQTFTVPSADRILNDGTGDCKHFAVLFATLARINNIPTRFAFGLRYIGGTYAYHVWNQVYIDGEWLDIDPSDLSFFPGALHIQLDVSASFNEKSHLGAILGFHPDPDFIELEYGEPDYFAVHGELPTELTDTHYQDAYFNCRITFPAGLEHKVVDLGFMKKISFTLPDEPRFAANAYMIPLSGNERDRASVFEGWGSQEMVHMIDLFGGMKRLKYDKVGRTTIDGNEAEFITGHFLDRNNQFIKTDLTILELENRMFIFHLAAPTDIYAKKVDQFGFIKEVMEIF